MKEVSIIIPVYKDLKGLQLTVSDIVNSNGKLTIEIIVCNDGNDNEIKNFCQKNNIQHIGIDTVKGSYFARNRGIERAKYDLLLFIDADVRLKNGWEQLIMNSNAPYSAFQINVFVAKNTLFHLYNACVDFNTEAFFKNNHFGVTAFLLVDKQIFSQIGKFNESLLSGGDLEFGCRCYINNIQQKYFANAFILHRSRGLIEKFHRDLRVMLGKEKVLALYPHYPLTLKKLSFKSLIKTCFATILLINKKNEKTKNLSNFERITGLLSYQLINFIISLIVLLKLKKA